MRAIWLSMAAALAVGSAALAQDGPPRTFRPQDIFALQQASDPEVRPDGGAIAYVRIANDIMTDRARRSIWLVDPLTGAQTPIAADDRSNLAPRWSPDGKRLAFISAGPGGPPQLFVRWMATGETVKVATLPEAPEAVAWSPDGRTLAFTMLVADEGVRLGAPMAKPEGAQWAEPLRVYDRVTYRADGEGYLKPGFSHVFVVSADGGQPRQLTFGRYNETGPLSWAPDGKALLLSSNRDKEWERDPLEREVYELAVDTGALRVLTHRKGPDYQAAVSPDGKLVAYVGYDDKGRGYENERLYVMDRDGTNVRVLTGALDRTVADPKWAADGRSIYVDYADKGVVKVARVSLDGRIDPVADGLTGGGLDRPYSGGDYSVSRTGLVAVTASGAERPADLAVVRRDGLQALTRLNEDLFTGRTVGHVAALPTVSSFDGKAIDAWIVTPPGFDPAKKYPLILEIHGGPFASYGPAFSTDNQLYAAAGYVVVYSNPRGSTSYGEAFANEIDKNYPSHDYDDLISVVDAAIAKGFVDPGRLYVTGGSGGGVLTAWIVGKTDRFRAAATQKPVINWASEVLTTDDYAFMGRYWFGKTPWEDPQGYWARSPLSLVGNVKTPTLVVVGDNDLRTPGGEAEQYYAALQLRGVPTALVKVPGASHGGIASRPSQSAAKAQAILAWFERFK